MKKTLLVTGANGFIGRNLVEGFKDTYILLTPSHSELDLIDETAVTDYFQKHHINIVIHCANVGGTRKTLYSADAVEKNLRMFFNIVKNQSRFDKMIHFGSGAEFDKRFPIIKVKESDFGLRIPKDQYGFYKYICSSYAQSASKIVVLRLFGVFGRYEDYKLRFISNAIVDTLLNNQITINQNVNFDYLYVKDLVKIVESFLSHTTNHKLYNVGSGKSIDLLTLANVVREVSGKQMTIRVKKKGMQNEYTCDNSLLNKEMGDFQFTPIEVAVRELYNWYANTDKAKWTTI